ncbi:MAG TPA: DMT family transporter [Patescibacteria group bacterium]|nr:DMT family transporter [Candidatus Saccharimonadales bacterium]HSX46507.1 DMT family transporter [Patescibacteria group bacterium]
MPHDLLVAMLAGLGGMLGWGTADFFAKKTIDKIGDVTTLFWGQLIGIFPLIVLIIAYHPHTPTHSHDTLKVILLGVYSGLSYIPAYIAFGKGKLSLLSPIFASYAAIVALISASVFHEQLTNMQQLAIVIVFCGILLVSTNPLDLFKLLKGHSRHKTDGLNYILVATVSYSFWLIALDRFLNGRNWVPFLLGIRVFSAITLFLYAVLSGRKLFIRGHKMWKYLIGIGVFDVFAFASVSYGFSATPHTAIVTVLAATFSIPTIILARTFLNERVSPLQALASITILAGIVLLSVS